MTTRSSRTKAGSKQSRWPGTTSGRTGRTSGGLGALALAGVLVAVSLAGAAPSPGGQAQPAQEQGQPPAAAATSRPVPDPPGVSLARIRRGLREAPRSTKSSLLKLEFHVDVVGMAPKFDLFKGIDLTTGPVQYGGMTHSEFMKLVAPPWRRMP